MGKQFLENSLSTTLVQDIINQGDTTIENIVAQQESSKNAITAQFDLEIQRINIATTQNISTLEEKKNDCVVVLNQTASNNNTELINTFNSKNSELISTGESKKQKLLDLYVEKIVAIDDYGDDKILEVKNQTDAQVKRVRDQGNIEVQRVIDAGVTDKVKKSGDTMTGVLTVPTVRGIATGKYTNSSTNEKSWVGLSAEDGYGMLWRFNDSQDKSDEFIGLTPGYISSVPVARIATGGGKGNFKDYKLYHEGFKPTLTDIGGGTFTNTVQHNGQVQASGYMNLDGTTYESGGSFRFGIIGLNWRIGVIGLNGHLGFFTYDNDSPSKRPYDFDQNGTFTASGNIIAYSDIKLKEKLEVIQEPIAKIQALNGYTYTRKDSGERQAGVVAQEVQKVLPEVVVVQKDENDNETLGVAYGNMVGLLIEGIKEQQKQIEELKKRIEELEGRQYV